MPFKRTLQLIHFTSTAWLIMCIGYILVLTLRQANVSWWVIFSLSGHSVLLVYLLVSLYLFAVFRGVASGRETFEHEHPLTSTEMYMLFYNICPFLGFLAGMVVAFAETRISQILLITAMGTLVTTFFVWIIIDPLIGMVETMCPASRKHRAQRVAEEKALRLKQAERREALLADALLQNELSRNRQAEILMTKAEKIVEVIINGQLDSQAKYEIIEIGVNTWVMGGLNAMKQLQELTFLKFKEMNSSFPVSDYLSALWDGIGDWRNKSLV